MSRRERYYLRRDFGIRQGLCGERERENLPTDEILALGKANAERERERLENPSPWSTRAVHTVAL